jgi:hypothetical protein
MPPPPPQSAVIRAAAPAKRPPGPPPAGAPKELTRWTVEDARKQLALLEEEESEKRRLQTKLRHSEEEATGLRETQGELLARIAHATRAAQDFTSSHEQLLKEAQTDLKASRAQLERLKADHRLALELIVTLGSSNGAGSSNPAASRKSLTEKRMSLDVQRARRQSLQPLPPSSRPPFVPSMSPDKGFNVRVVGLAPVLQGLSSPPKPPSPPPRSAPRLPPRKSVASAASAAAAARSSKALAHQSPEAYQAALREDIAKLQASRPSP